MNRRRAAFSMFPITPSNPGSSSDCPLRGSTPFHHVEVASGSEAVLRMKFLLSPRVPLFSLTPVPKSAKSSIFAYLSTIPFHFPPFFACTRHICASQQPWTYRFARHTLCGFWPARRFLTRGVNLPCPNIHIADIFKRFNEDADKGGGQNRGYLIPLERGESFKHLICAHARL